MSGRHGDRKWTDERAKAHRDRWAHAKSVGRVLTANHIGDVEDTVERAEAIASQWDADDFPDLLDAWEAERKRADAAEAALRKVCAQAEADLAILDTQRRIITAAYAEIAELKRRPAQEEPKP